MVVVVVVVVGEVVVVVVAVVVGVVVTMLSCIFRQYIPPRHHWFGERHHGSNQGNKGRKMASLAHVRKSRSGSHRQGPLSPPVVSERAAGRSSAIAR